MLRAFVLSSTERSFEKRRFYLVGEGEKIFGMLREFGEPVKMNQISGFMA